MSIQAVTWAKRAHVGNADEKHTLLLLADYHSAKTGECFPSQEALAADSERSLDTIQRHLKSLIAKGLISRGRRYVDGYRKSDRYTLAINGKLKPQDCGVSDAELKPQQCGVSSEELKPHGCGVSADDLTPQNPDLTPQNPDLTPQNTPTLDRTGAAYKDERVEREDIEREERDAAAEATALARDDVIITELVSPFDTFWDAWPSESKVKKPRAQKAYAKALKKASADAILAGLERYKRTKPDWQNWAHPASWLNDERWNDKPAPQRKSSFEQDIVDANMRAKRRAHLTVVEGVR